MTTRLDYVHEQVYGRVTPELALEASRFWEENGVVPSADERHRRARELAAVVHESTGKLAGVGTAYRDTIQRGDGQLEVYMYRTFIDPRQRKPLLFLSLFFTACAALENASVNGRPSHVAFVTENRKFMRRGVVNRVFEANGFKLLGHDQYAQSCWVYPLFWDGPHRRLADSRS